MVFISRVWPTRFSSQLSDAASLCKNPVEHQPNNCGDVFVFTKGILI